MARLTDKVLAAQRMSMRAYPAYVRAKLIELCLKSPHDVYYDGPIGLQPHVIAEPALQMLSGCLTKLSFDVNVFVDVEGPSQMRRTVFMGRIVEMLGRNLQDLSISFPECEVDSDPAEAYHDLVWEAIL